MRPTLPVLHLILTLPLTGIAQDFKPGLRLLGDLPPHLSFQEGKMNLVVDYAAAKGNGVPLYVVNATDLPKPIPVHHPLIQETLCDDGKWRRSTPTVPPWCGADFDSQGTIAPSAFYQTSIWLNARRGERRKVRYREYIQNDRFKWTTNWISNEGMGLVDRAEVEASRFDYIGASLGPFEDVARIVLKQVPPLDRPNLPRIVAFDRLTSWVEEPRRIDLLKQVITMAKAESDSEAYSLAFLGLANPSPPEWTEEAYWKFAVAELKSGHSLSSHAFQSVINAPFFPEGKRVLLDQIVANPRDANLESAILGYAKIAGDAAAKKMAQRILRSSKYAERAKATADEVLAALQRNR